MSDSVKILDHIAVLFDAWVDDTLDDKGREELLAAMRDDVPLRRALLADLKVQRALRAEVLVGDDPKTVVQRVTAIVRQSNRLRACEAVFPKKRAKLSFPLVAAIGSLAAAAGLLLGINLLSVQSQPLTISEGRAVAHVQSGVTVPVLAVDGALRAGPTADSLLDIQGGQDLALPCELEVTHGTARIALPGQGELTLTAGTRLGISAAGSNIVVRRGALKGDLGESCQWLLTPHSLAWVQGANVDLQVADDLTTVRSLDGKLRVEGFDGSSTTVEAGQQGQFARAPRAQGGVQVIHLASLTAGGVSLPASKPKASALQVGETRVFSAQLRDQFTNTMEMADLTSWVALGGTLDRSSGASVTFTAGDAGVPAMIVVNHAGLTARRDLSVR